MKRWAVAVVCLVVGCGTTNHQPEMTRVERIEALVGGTLGLMCVDYYSKPGGAPFAGGPGRLVKGRMVLPQVAALGELLHYRDAAPHCTTDDDALWEATATEEAHFDEDFAVFDYGNTVRFRVSRVPCDSSPCTLPTETAVLELVLAEL